MRESLHHKKTIGKGWPNEELICTPHVEKQNDTVGMQVPRLRGLTDAFSKMLQNFEAAMALHLAY